MHAIVKSVEKKVTKKDTNYFLFKLMLEGGKEVTGVQWEVGDAAPPAEGAILDLMAEEKVYNDTVQLVISNWIAVVKTTDLLMKFMRSTKRDINELWANVNRHVQQNMVGHEKAVVEAALLLYETPFKQSPAADKHHHNWIGGLMEHISELCDMAEKIVPSHFPEANLSKVMWGLIMHDFGKIYEYKWDQGMIQYSPEGNLLGHIGQAGHFLRPIMDECQVPMKDQYELLHIVLAHHGRKDWGSPVLPATVEALLVHHLDNMHAQFYNYMNYVWRAKEAGKKPGELTEKTWGNDMPKFIFIPEDKNTQLSTADEEIPF